MVMIGCFFFHLLYLFCLQMTVLSINKNSDPQLLLNIVSKNDPVVSVAMSTRPIIWTVENSFCYMRLLCLPWALGDCKQDEVIHAKKQFWWQSRSWRIMPTTVIQREAGDSRSRWGWLEKPRVFHPGLSWGLSVHVTIPSALFLHTAGAILHNCSSCFGDPPTMLRDTCLQDLLKVWFLKFLK